MFRDSHVTLFGCQVGGETRVTYSQLLRHFACALFDGTPASGGLAHLGVGIVSEI